MNFWQLIWFFDSLSYSLQALYFFLNISGPLFRACLLLLLKCFPLCVNVLDAVEKKKKHRAKCLKSMSSIQPFRDECSRGVPYCRCLTYVDMVWNSVPCWGQKKEKEKENLIEKKKTRFMPLFLIPPPPPLWSDFALCCCAAGFLWESVKSLVTVPTGTAPCV